MTNNNFIKHKRKNLKKAVLTDEQIIKLYKIPDEKYLEYIQLPYDEFKLFNNFRRVYKFERDLEYLINMFTLNKIDEYAFNYLCSKLKKDYPTKNIDIKIKKSNKSEEFVGFEFKSKNINFKAFKPYNYFSGLKKYMPMLESEYRFSQCHWLAIRFSSLLSLNRIENEVVSGYPFQTFKCARYSHSWVEFKSENGADLVFDSTLGIIMTKEGYYKLKQPKKISRISHKDIIREYGIFKDLDKIADSWANDLYFHDREMALRVYEDRFKKKFVPRDYDDCIRHPEKITLLENEDEKQPGN